MKLLGNIIWLIFGGLVMAISWFLLGVVYCVTIIGIPFGLQGFKIASLSLWPFGREAVRTQSGAGRLIGNVIWIIFGGLELFIGHVLIGLIFYITIIGIPFGKQQFKLAKLALTPFGYTIKEIKK